MVVWVGMRDKESQALGMNQEARMLLIAHETLSTSLAYTAPIPAGKMDCHKQSSDFDLTKLQQFFYIGNDTILQTAFQSQILSVMRSLSLLAIAG